MVPVTNHNIQAIPACDIIIIEPHRVDSIKVNYMVPSLLRNAARLASVVPEVAKAGVVAWRSSTSTQSTTPDGMEATDSVPV